jgi:hypothetical protein
VFLVIYTTVEFDDFRIKITVLITLQPIAIAELSAYLPHSTASHYLSPLIPIFFLQVHVFP